MEEYEMRFRYLICLIGLFVISFLMVTLGIVTAEEKEKIYSLEKSIEEALANNWSIKAKQEKINEADYVKRQARAEFLPKFGTSYSYKRDSEARTFRSAAGGNIAISSMDNYEWRASIEQPIFTGFALSSSLELAKLGIDQSELDLELAKQDLILKVKEAYQPVEVEDILIYKPETVDFKGYLDSALKNRPEIKVLDINLLQTDQEIRLAKGKYYPEAALTYDYIKAGDSPDVTGSTFHDANRWETMAVLSWTFWEWGKTLNSVKEKESFKRQLDQTKKALINNISLEIKKAVLDIDEADKNIPTTTKAVEQAEENLRVSEERYKAQVTTMNEVLDAQTLLTQARVNYYRALYGHNLAKARLRRAIGEY